MKIYQDDGLYKFTSDSVLLSRFARAKKNEKAADFCAGSGIVGLHFYALNRPLVKSVDLFEMQEKLCDLSEKSVKLNGLEGVFFVHRTKLQNIGAEYAEAFSLILCNPPYFPRSAAKGENYSVDAGRCELEITLEEIVEKSAKCLKWGGRLCIAHSASRLAELFASMQQYHLEPKRLCPVGGGGKIYLVLVEAVKGGKPGLKIESQKEN